VIVILDRQHIGKPNRNDLGAGADLDGDGEVSNDEREANLTIKYIEAAAAYLMDRGHIVYILDSGYYSDRHRRACDIARSAPTQKAAYVACHLNAGGGDYAVTIHDSRSRGGKSLAECVAESMKQAAGEWIPRSLVRPSSPDGSWSRAFNTIGGIYSGPASLSGICFEPAFMDCELHRPLLTEAGLVVLGRALAIGCLRWAGE
jgi:hypothetical protein